MTATTTKKTRKEQVLMRATRKLLVIKDAYGLSKYISCIKKQHERALRLVKEQAERTPGF